VARRVAGTWKFLSTVSEFAISLPALRVRRSVPILADSSGAYTPLSIASAQAFLPGIGKPSYPIHAYYSTIFAVFAFGVNSFYCRLLFDR